MDIDTIWTNLAEIFRDVFEDETIALARDTTAADVEDWDSLTHVQLMVAVEQAFGIHFTTGEVANLRHVGQMVDLIHLRTEQVAPS